MNRAIDRANKVCRHCSKELDRADINYRKKRYCDRACYIAAMRAFKIERFWSRVDKSAGNDACWPWKATKLPQGYGIVQIAALGLKYPAGAHRVAYWLTHGGEFPKDPVCVLHSCDNPPCCNPAHLRLGDRIENNADKLRKGRHNGSHTPVEKLLHPQFSVRVKK